jgi:hypothetical protein
VLENAGKKFKSVTRTVGNLVKKQGSRSGCGKHFYFWLSKTHIRSGPKICISHFFDVFRKTKIEILTGDYTGAQTWLEANIFLD